MIASRPGALGWGEGEGGGVSRAGRVKEKWEERGEKRREEKRGRFPPDRDKPVGPGEVKSKAMQQIGGRTAPLR